uniref:Uncharacterized protein n=1 Tax=Rhizophora mucronata TaxID=61149 RepID=A0A2P2QFS9_RHIMU
MSEISKGRVLLFLKSSNKDNAYFFSTLLPTSGSHNPLGPLNELLIVELKCVTCSF